ncbi:unnamed protein product, partial [Durusdinium trenchii]
MAWGLKKKDPKAYFSYLAQHPEVYAKQQEDRDRWREGLPQVLMVAEKPSVARLVAECLCGEGRGDRVRERRGLAAACPVLEFVAVFPPTGQRSVITMTSVIGHIFQLEFDGQLSNDLVEVYSAPVVKVFTESARKVRVGEHLKDLAKDSSQLCLWLDADDREGENIGFEVIALCKEFFDETKIHRAIFSALTKDEVSASFQALGRPNADIAMGVDTRQELDLRVGIAFSRLLTRHLRNTPLARRGKGLKPSITYGPCQTPALGFCVQRQDEIDAFRPKKIWRPTLELDPAEAQALRRALTDANSAELQLAVKEDGRVMGGRGRSCAMDSAKLASISAPFGPRLRDLSEALHSPSWSIALGDRTLLSAEALDIQGDEVVARLFRFVPGQGFVDSGDDYISKLRLPRLGDRPINLFTGAHFTCVGLVVNCTKDMLEFSEGVALGIRPEFVPDMAWSFLHQFAGAFSGWKQAVQWLGKSGTNFVLGQQVSVDAATEVIAELYDRLAIGLPSLSRCQEAELRANQFPEYTTAAGAASDMDTSPQHKSSPSQPAAAAPSEKQDPLPLPNPVTPVLLIHRLNPLRLTGTRFVALPANCNGDMRKEMLPRPLGLNTVQLLRAASNALNLGPKQAMKVAEDHVKEMAFQDLYSSGLISYPRTETTRYHETFDARPSLRPLTMLKLVGAAQALKTWMAQSHQQSYRARDVGDHPPIVPLRTPEPGEVSGQQKRLYDYVCQHFVASWLADVKLQRYEATVEIEGFQFQLLLRLFGASSGWLQAMPWRIRELSLGRDDPRCSILKKLHGRKVHLKGFQLAESWTEPPKPLTEAELVELMDQNGIGTDASIPQHIQTIQDRAYVQLHDGDGQPILPHFGPQRGKAPPKRAPGRYLVPSRRGLALVKGLSALDASLCEPEVRALIERECAMVATAEMKQEAVLQRNVALFREKFLHVASSMDEVKRFFEESKSQSPGLRESPKRSRRR